MSTTDSHVHDLAEAPIAVRGMQDNDGVRGHLVADAADAGEVAIETTGHTSVLVNGPRWTPLRDAIDKALGTTPTPGQTPTNARRFYSASDLSLRNAEEIRCRSASADRLEVAELPHQPSCVSVRTYEHAPRVTQFGPVVHLDTAGRRKLAERLLRGLEDSATADPPAAQPIQVPGLPAPSDVDPDSDHYRRAVGMECGDEVSVELRYRSHAVEHPIEISDGNNSGYLTLDNARQLAANLAVLCAEYEQKHGITPPAASQQPQAAGMPGPSSPDGGRRRRSVLLSCGDRIAVCPYESADIEHAVEIYESDRGRTGYLSPTSARTLAANLIAVSAEWERKHGITPPAATPAPAEPAQPDGQLGPVKDLTLTDQTGAQVMVEGRGNGRFGIWKRNSGGEGYGLGVLLDNGQRRQLIEALGGTVGAPVAPESTPQLPAPAEPKGSYSNPVTASPHAAISGWSNALVAEGMNGGSVALAPCGSYYRVDSIPGAQQNFDDGTAQMDAEHLRQLAANAIDAAQRIETNNT